MVIIVIRIQLKVAFERQIGCQKYAYGLFVADFSVHLQETNANMRITLLCVGKTDDPHFVGAIERFQQRLKHYIQFQLVIIPDIRNTKNLRIDQQKAQEGSAIMKHVSPSDHLVLLDEQGKEFRSVEFAGYLNKLMVGSAHHVVFVVGGPYGFDDTVYQRANNRISLSKMTFSHQMVRLFFVEQLYRAFSILKGEPYHHE